MTHNHIELKSRHEIHSSGWVSRRMKRVLWAIFLFGVLILFLPWTQNIQGNGMVTTLLPGQRPQEIQTLIGGRIEKWFVKEGDFVKKGDTIVRISEIKENYLDPNLLSQTEKQVEAKENSVLSYSSKVDAVNAQISQLEINRNLKMQQSENKLQQEQLKLKSEEAEMEAARISYTVAVSQFQRDSMLLLKGLKSPLDLENRKTKMQESFAKYLSAKNKVSSAIAAVENARFEIRNVNAEYSEKLAKAEGDRYSTISSQMEAEAEVSKLRNTLSNYTIRNGFYTIMAPQDGYISRAMASGIGETIKEGTAVCSIMPKSMTPAVELFLDPVDMPLVKKGNKVRFVFDGWPTVVFSGWPNFTFGTFEGSVFAIDNILSPNGKYRILVSANMEFKKWPAELRVGTGAHAYMLLNNVPVWYEMWRQWNGFPPDYYQTTKSAEKGKKK